MASGICLLAGGLLGLCLAGPACSGELCATSLIMVAAGFVSLKDGWPGRCTWK